MEEKIYYTPEESKEFTGVYNTFKFHKRRNRHLANTNVVSYTELLDQMDGMFLLPRPEQVRFVKAFFYLILDAVMEGKSVNIPELGTFFRNFRMSPIPEVDSVYGLMGNTAKEFKKVHFLGFKPNKRLRYLFNGPAFYRKKSESLKVSKYHKNTWEDASEYIKAFNEKRQVVFDNPVNEAGIFEGYEHVSSFDPGTSLL